MKKLSLKTKLLIYEYKERFPQLSPIEISMAFYIEYEPVEELFKKEYIIVPSKINK
jgi:hypothetical protein